jgi:hypothetical protein
LLQVICAQLAAYYPSIEKQMTKEDRRSLFLSGSFFEKNNLWYMSSSECERLGPDQSAFSGIAWQRALNGGSEGRTLSRVSLNIPGRSGQQ